MLTALLKKHLRAYRSAIWAVLILQLIQTIASLYLPRFNADIINKGVLTGDTGYIWRHGGIMLGITVVQVAFAVAAVYFAARAAMGFGRDVRAALFHQVTDFSTQEVGLFGAPSLITRITNDVQQVQMLVLMGATLAVAAPITLVGGTIMALNEDVGLSKILLVSVPVLVIIVSLVVSKMIPTFRQMQERVDNINRVLREQITGIRVIRAFVREPDEAARFGGANDELTATSLTAGHLMALMFPSIMIVLNLSTVAAVWVGADRVHERAMQVGALIAFLSYLAQILMSVMMASFMAIMIPRAAVCAERIMEVLNTPSSIVTQKTPVAAPQHTSTLELREVGFAYPGAEAPVLHDISFTLHRGETLAIIGSTGSGKTTLLNVIPRLIDVTSGAVLLDGIDIREIQTESLWNHIGLVPQRPFLFSGTVASNLRFSAPNATDEELWEALRIAQAEDFVRAMPGGLDEPIHQGGTNVSGGQRQRLAIARALVRKPQIFLFDDSFSALDLATDARLRAALEPQLEESIAIIVAQRVSTIATADHILVLEDGAVVGLDTHEQLLEHCPTYQEIVASQAAVEAAA